MASIRRSPTADLTAAELRVIRQLLDEAFAHEDADERFADADWAHALGGTHVIVETDGRIVSHASVVPRVLEIDGRPLHAGYVEAVATWPDAERRGYGSMAMREANEIIRTEYELGALGTGRLEFYARLGWETWRGPSSVRTTEGPVRTPDEDGFIMVLRTPTTPPLDLDAPISCDWREGDVW